MTLLRFPADFRWGVATSAQQIEGSYDRDGRSESIWDHMAAEPGRIADGSDPRVACDHYVRWAEDVRHLRELGVGAYRFSVAWPRVIPTGRGRVNETGLDFYDRLVDALLASYIEPFVTLYHWDLPQVLQESGGWAERATTLAFAEFADAVAARLGDRVRYWTTHNEPWCIAFLGHEQGEHAPGHRDPAEALRVAHHILLSHGLATERIRSTAARPQVGIVLNLVPGYPYTSSDADRDAVRHHDGAFNRWFLDPLFRGSYPEDAIADRVRLGHLRSSVLPFVDRGDMDRIRQPLDYLGVNYYGRVVVRASPDGPPEAVQVVPDDELTDMGWEVFPQGLAPLLERLTSDYDPTHFYIAENGAAYSDGPDRDGRIRDARRTEFLRSHIAAVHDAIECGVPLRGYFVWSLLDNFEWAHGYRMRFGLYWVDFETLERSAKDSASWYRDVIAQNAVEHRTSQSAEGNAFDSTN